MERNVTRTRTRRRVGAREARRAQRNKRAAGSVGASLRGGTYKPLSDRDIERVHQTALDVLEKVGMGNPPPILRERALARGCWVDDHDRLCFPRTLVEDVIAAMPREIVMHGLDPDYDMESSAGRVIFAPGGDAVTTLDVDKRSYRSSTLVDVYDFARLIDWLEHVHEFTPVVVATDIQDLRAANLNSAYAAISGTSKHVCLSPNTVTDVDDIIELMNLIAGGEKKRRERRASPPGGGGSPDGPLLRHSRLGGRRHVRCEVARCPGRLRKRSHRYGCRAGRRRRFGSRGHDGESHGVLVRGHGDRQ